METFNCILNVKPFLMPSYSKHSLQGIPIAKTFQIHFYDKNISLIIYNNPF